MNTKIVAGVIGALTLTACASGSGHGSDTNEPIRALLSADALMFVAFDSDGNLSTSTQEMEAGSAREFARADTNRDGQVQPIEFQNWANAVLGGGQLGPYRLDFDRNVDNVITREEFDTEIRGRMRDYDEDESGDLRRSELIRLVGQARPPSRRPETSPMGGRPMN